MNLSGYALEGNAQTHASGGELWGLITCEVIETFQEEAHATGGLETNVYASTDLIGATVAAVGGKTAAGQA